MAAERSKDDFYETRAEATRPMLPELGSLVGRSVLEPEAGRGAIVAELVRAGAHPGAIVAVELDPERASYVRGISPLIRVTTGDFLKLRPRDFEPFDFVVMNPPYAQAQAHIEHALKFLAPWGQLAALLLLSFTCGQRRRDFRTAHPYDLFPLAERPGFATGEQIGAGSGVQQALFDVPITLPHRDETDMREYAWFLFGPGRGAKHRTLEPLNVQIGEGEATSHRSEARTFAALAVPPERD